MKLMCPICASLNTKQVDTEKYLFVSQDYGDGDKEYYDDIQSFECDKKHYFYISTP